MELAFREIGEGKPIIITHGVFGSGDNLFTVSKQIADAGHKVFLVDARNHGLSPHSHIHDYPSMAEDLWEFIQSKELENPTILGHSMGGKSVLQYTQKYSNFGKAIVVDIAPKAYTPHHEHIFKGLEAIPIHTLESRKQAEDIFSEYVVDLGERQFILKNIYRSPEGGFAWRINVEGIRSNRDKIIAEIPLTKQVDKPILFIKGELSPYIQEEDKSRIKEFYSQATFVTLHGANHWVHATKPADFVKVVLNFML